MLIGVFGPQGSGKTLLSMLLSRMCLDSYYKANPEQPRDIKIYTNVNASGDAVVTISDLGEIPFDRTPKILILDEAMFSIDSRRAGSDQNVIWSKMVAFFRKLNFLMVFYNTHTPQMVDNRIRDQLAFIIMCRKAKAQFEYLMLDMISQQTKPIFIPRSQELYDYTDFDTYDFPNPVETDLLVEKYDTLFKVKSKKDKEFEKKKKLMGL